MTNEENESANIKASDPLTPQQDNRIFESIPVRPAPWAKAEAGSQMNKERALGMFRTANQWLYERIAEGATCACGNCYLCAYNFFAATASPAGPREEAPEVLPVPAIVHPFGPCGYLYCDWPDGELRCNEVRTSTASPAAPKEEDDLAQWSSVDNWPLPDVLNKLADATECLLHDYNYDRNGWEQLKYAALAARRHVALLATTPSPDAASAHNSNSIRLASQEDKTMTNEEHERAEDLVDRWLRGHLEGTSKANQRWVPIIKQLCRDLNEAHNEILRQQGVAESDYGKFDWPEWTPQANSIRWAERETKERLAKTDHWTLYPTPTPPSSEEKTGVDSPARERRKCSKCGEDLGFNEGDPCSKCVN